MSAVVVASLKISVYSSFIVKKWRAEKKKFPSDFFVIKLHEQDLLSRFFLFYIIC